MSDTPPPPPPPAAPPPPPPPPVGEPPPGSAPGGQQLVEGWKRLVARALDIIILAVVGLVIAAIILSGDDSAGLGGFSTDASFGELYVLGLLGVAVSFVWDAVCTKMYGGSPMKLAFGMKVVQAESGAPVEWDHSIRRWAVSGALALIPIPVLPGLARLVIGVIAIIFIFTKPLRQTLSDLFAKTIVVNSR